MKKEILIPSGIKATMYQDGDKVVIEYEEKKWEPKIGDVVICSVQNKTSGEDIIGIYNKSGMPLFFGFRKNVPIVNCCFGLALRPTTPDERATFFADLKKEGYKWDSKKMVLKKIEEVFVPKDGDFVHLPENEHLNESIIIYQKKYGFHSGIPTNNDRLSIQTEEYGVEIIPDRLATPSEKQRLLDAMHKAGKDWDAVNKKVVDYVWKPKTGERYYAPAPIHNEKYVSFLWEEDYIDNRRLSEGLVYRTSEEAIARAKRMLNTK